jgi:hypothetical protein
MNPLHSALSLLRHRRVPAALLSAVGVAGALVLAGWLAHWPVRTGSAGTPPPAAVTAVTGLTSRNSAALSAALAAGYPVSAGDVAPAGTTIRVQPGTWEQKGDYATVRAVVTLPGRAPLAETIYFAQEEGRWRVLFADPS